MTLNKSQELQPANFFQTHRYNIIRIFMALADREKPVNGKQLATEIDVAPKTFEKLASFLKNNEFVVSTMGAYGGYKLAAKPKDITLLDMVGFTITPEIEPHGIYEAMIKITNYYDTITLADLIDWDR